MDIDKDDETALQLEQYTDLYDFAAFLDKVFMSPVKGTCEVALLRA